MQDCLYMHFHTQWETPIVCQRSVVPNAPWKLNTENTEPAGSKLAGEYWLFHMQHMSITNMQCFVWRRWRPTRICWPPMPSPASKWCRRPTTACFRSRNATSSEENNRLSFSQGRNKELVNCRGVDCATKWRHTDRVNTSAHVLPLCLVVVAAMPSFQLQINRKL